MLLRIIRSYKVILGVTRCYYVLLDSTAGCFSMLLGATRYYPRITGSY